MLSTQGVCNAFQRGIYFQQDIAEGVSDHVLLNSKGLLDGTNQEEAQQKRSQTEICRYETVNVDSLPQSTQGLHEFTQSKQEGNYDEIRDRCQFCDDL
ncbi:MAG: hypothetical protein EZS28_044585 [Streblomastix strix]|uniref:Uncharacterized protein n=1 Tax=Streblomastix strix TaxID=222440 RepID=A0A5J4TNV4_9EUKA|nr:MAG: hypothetical protein EZS28_044585 [Streblomastix strix]